MASKTEEQKVKEEEAHKEAHEKEEKKDEQGPCEPVGGALKGAFDAITHGAHEARTCRRP